MSAPRKQYRKGDPARSFSADDYNAIAAEVERWSNLKAIAPLAIGDGPGGRYLTRDGEPSFYAKLSGSSSPYSWTEQVETATGVWANGERSGTDAYEVNSRASLNNKIARLYPTAFDHRFRHVRLGGPSTPTPPVCGCGSVPAPTTITCTAAYTSGGAPNPNYAGYYTSRFSSWAVAGLVFNWVPIPADPAFPTFVASAPEVAATGYIHVSTTSPGGFRHILFPGSSAGVCFWSLARYAPTLGGFYSSPFVWAAGGTGTNTCSPWHYDFGSDRAVAELGGGYGPAIGQQIFCFMN